MKSSRVRYSVLLEPVEDREGLPGFYYAHVPSLGLTTHGSGVEGAIEAARDLIRLWVVEKREASEHLVAAGESLLTTVEVE
ncbi:MAG TPA: type II toxin-antitoxin system HicB family antitoxin [Verrucomicrobiales bacterium]|nr:type II toxin-antitoxin system HicB family antitoxin [Verrucomicrobiales bacterium]